LNAAEQTGLLAGWRGPQLDLPAVTRVHALIVAQAAPTPPPRWSVT
jgi:hypothetical protein